MLSAPSDEEDLLLLPEEVSHRLTRTAAPPQGLGEEQRRRSSPQQHPQHGQRSHVQNEDQHGQTQTVESCSRSSVGDHDAISIMTLDNAKIITLDDDSWNRFLGAGAFLGGGGGGDDRQLHEDEQQTSCVEIHGSSTRIQTVVGHHSSTRTQTVVASSAPPGVPSEPPAPSAEQNSDRSRIKWGLRWVQQVQDPGGMTWWNSSNEEDQSNYDGSDYEGSNYEGSSFRGEDDRSREDCEQGPRRDIKEDCEQGPRRDHSCEDIKEDGSNGKCENSTVRATAPATEDDRSWNERGPLPAADRESRDTRLRHGSDEAEGDQHEDEEWDLGGDRHEHEECEGPRGREQRDHSCEDIKEDEGKTGPAVTTGGLYNNKDSTVRAPTAPATEGEDVDRSWNERGAADQESRDTALSSSSSWSPDEDEERAGADFWTSSRSSGREEVRFLHEDSGRAGAAAIFMEESNFFAAARARRCPEIRSCPLLVLVGRPRRGRGEGGVPTLLIGGPSLVPRPINVLALCGGGSRRADCAVLVIIQPAGRNRRAGFPLVLFDVLAGVVPLLPPPRPLALLVLVPVAPEVPLLVLVLVALGLVRTVPESGVPTLSIGGREWSSLVPRPIILCGGGSRANCAVLAFPIAPVLFDVLAGVVPPRPLLAVLFDVPPRPLLAVLPRPIILPSKTAPFVIAPFVIAPIVIALILLVARIPPSHAARILNLLNPSEPPFDPGPIGVLLRRRGGRLRGDTRRSRTSNYCLGPRAAVVTNYGLDPRAAAVDFYTRSLLLVLVQLAIVPTATSSEKGTGTEKSVPTIVIERNDLSVIERHDTDSVVISNTTSTARLHGLCLSMLVLVLYVGSLSMLWVLLR